MPEDKLRDEIIQRRKDALEPLGLYDPMTHTKMLSRKHLALPVEVRAKQLDSGLFLVRGYAAVFNNLDNHGDIIVQGAFTSGGLRERFQTNLIKFLLNHDELIGLPTVLEEDSLGLYFEGHIVPTRLGKDVFMLIESGALDRMSVWIDILKFTEFDDDELRATLPARMEFVPMWRLEKLLLREVSAVTFAANEATTIQAVSDSIIDRDVDGGGTRNPGDDEDENKSYDGGNDGRMIAVKDAGGMVYVLNTIRSKAKAIHQKPTNEGADQAPTVPADNGHEPGNQQPAPVPTDATKNDDQASDEALDISSIASLVQRLSSRTAA